VNKFGTIAGSRTYQMIPIITITTTTAILHVII